MHKGANAGGCQEQRNVLQYLTRNSVSRYTGNKSSGSEEPQRWYEGQGADSAKPTGGLAQLCFLPAAKVPTVPNTAFASNLHFSTKGRRGRGRHPHRTLMMCTCDTDSTGSRLRYFRGAVSRSDRSHSWSATSGLDAYCSAAQGVIEGSTHGWGDSAIETSQVSFSILPYNCPTGRLEPGHWHATVQLTFLGTRRAQSP